MSFVAMFSVRDNRWQGQFLRYFIVGGAAFVVDFTALFLLTEFLHLHYLLSATIAFMGGIAVTYAFAVTWVFDQRSADNRLYEFAVFAVVGGVGLGLNVFLMWLLTELVGLHYLGSKVVAAAAVFIFNFAARKTLLFSVPAGEDSALR